MNRKVVVGVLVGVLAVVVLVVASRDSTSSDVAAEPEPQIPSKTAADESAAVEDRGRAGKVSSSLRSLRTSNQQVRIVSVELPEDPKQGTPERRLAVSVGLLNSIFERLGPLSEDEEQAVLQILYDAQENYLAEVQEVEQMSAEATLRKRLEKQRMQEAETRRQVYEKMVKDRPELANRPAPSFESPPLPDMSEEHFEDFERPEELANPARFAKEIAKQLQEVLPEEKWGGINTGLLGFFVGIGADERLLALD